MVVISSNFLFLLMRTCQKKKKLDQNMLTSSMIAQCHMEQGAMALPQSLLGSILVPNITKDQSFLLALKACISYVPHNVLTKIG